MNPTPVLGSGYLPWARYPERRTLIEVRSP